MKNENNIREAAELLAQSECIVEQWMNLDKEVSVIVHRNAKGETVCLPVAENIHKHHILHQTIVPARITPDQEAKALNMRKKLLKD